MKLYVALVVLAFVELSSGFWYIKRCPVGQIFKRCGSACTRTCENPVPACTRQCVRRCECPGVQVLNANGRCIDAEDCDVDPCRPIPGVSSPLTDGSGQLVRCSIRNQDCPFGASCLFSNKEQRAVCCANEGFPCTVGRPLQNPETGVDLNCGLIPQPDRCPRGSSCVVDSIDRFAKCCRVPTRG